MSSPRETAPCDGLIEFNQRPAGPIRLPDVHKDDFLKRFNAEYVGIGLKIATNPAYVIVPPTTIPESVTIVEVAASASIPVPVPPAGLPQSQQPSVFIEHLLGALREAFSGPQRWAYFTDRGADAGLLTLVHRLNLEQATAEVGGTSIAAHLYHLQFALNATSRWLRGDRSTVDWSSSWQRETLDQQGWEALKRDIDEAYRRLADTLTALDVQRGESIGVAVGSIAHVAYHLGAIRQKVAVIR